MNDRARVILVGIIGLIVGLVMGGGYGIMQTDEANQKLAAVTMEKEQAQQSADRLRKANDEAVKKYGAELGKLVMATGGGAQPAAPQPAPAQDPAAQQAAPAAQAAPVDPAKVIDSARSILAARDGFRSSLDGARAAMDSELDQLAMELGNPSPSAEKIDQLLSALKQNWPNKQKELDTATRKLLTDLGLFAAPKPAAAPASAPAPAPAPVPAAPEKK